LKEKNNIFFPSQRKPKKESHSAKEGEIRKSRFFGKILPVAKRRVEIFSKTRRA